MSRRTSQYDKRMALQSYTVTRSASKQNIKTWSNLVSFWGRIEFAYKGEEILSGSRRNETPKVASSSQVWVSTRLRSDVTFSPLRRIVYGSRVFEIIAYYLEPREIRVLCREVQE